MPYKKKVLRPFISFTPKFNYFKMTSNGLELLVLNCIKFPKRASTAIIVPYKDREEHLKLLLRYLHPNLQRQQISYCIFIAEQFHDGRFNKKGFLYS